VHPRGEHALHEGLFERRGRDAVVHAESDSLPAATADERAVGPPDLREDVRRDVDPDLAAHVVGAEDVRIDAAHEAAPLTPRRSLALGWAGPAWGGGPPPPGWMRAPSCRKTPCARERGLRGGGCP